ncbi:MAG: HD domain-containing protein [Euryarchaeota archaeon]|nr:HD domain-containing protein [Euryarchaeota archaeon]
MQSLRDSIHRNILVEDWALDLLDTREMQRLRRIRQLGTAFLVYPGANHTRFEHALGAYKLAGDAARALALSPDDARHLQAAALLHDVGHGPFSHLFEEVVPGQKHEEFSVDLVQWSGLNDLLKRAGLEPKRVASLLRGKGEHGSVVSGDIDVDRMDYLVRDAHYTGLRVSVDPERLLSVMTLRDGEFLVREEGVTACESLLVARFLMYPSVYFHHTCRAGESMLVRAAQDLLENGYHYDSLRVMDDTEFLSALKQGSRYARDVAERIDDRRLFKRAFEGTHRRVQGDAFLESVVRDPAERAKLEKELADAAGLNDGYVLVDVPAPPLVREVGAKVLGKDDRILPLREASTLVRTLVAAQMDHGKFWVFAPKESLPAVTRALERIASPQKVKPTPHMGAG